MTCFHCAGTTKCDCIGCGFWSTGAEWQAGKCVVCKDSNQREALLAYLDKHRIDPREKRHWRIEKSITGGHKHVFIPAEILSENPFAAD